MALEWIQEYISFFGGDPSNVTLVGESAGAGGISHLIASPLSKDLFHKAIHQSGGSSFTYPTSSSNVKKLANNFANSFKDPSIEHLKSISAEEILAVSEEVYAEHYFNYVDDNLSITENLSDIYKSGNVQNVDLLIGSNNDEWSLYFDGNVNIGLWLDQETTPEKKIKLLELLDDIKDPIRKMDLLITAKNFVCPSLFMADELGKKEVKPGYINLTELEMISWQKNMGLFMVQSFLMFLILMMSGYQQMKKTESLLERFNLIGYLLLRLEILIMAML